MELTCTVVVNGAS